jgi:hypothetical protein
MWLRLSICTAALVGNAVRTNRLAALFLAVLHWVRCFAHSDSEIRQPVIMSCVFWSVRLPSVISHPSLSRATGAVDPNSKHLEISKAARQDSDCAAASKIVEVYDGQFPSQYKVGCHCRRNNICIPHPASKQQKQYLLLFLSFLFFHNLIEHHLSST